MEKDIDAIFKKLSISHPDIKVRQLRVTHKNDDDGLWYFYVTEKLNVQLESSTYNFPFLLEKDIGEEKIFVHTVDETINEICIGLNIA